MKTTIYFFSGTGNSLAAARTLAKAIQLGRGTRTRFRYRHPGIVADDIAQAQR